MHIFIIGASGYIGGSLADALLREGHRVTGLARNAKRGNELQSLGIEPLIGTLDDSPAWIGAAKDADVVVNAANADHRPVVAALLDVLAGSEKVLVHTSGSSIVGDASGGEPTAAVFGESTPFTPPPLRAERVAINQTVLDGARRGVRTIVVAPSLIYGAGRGLHRDSIQIPWLAALARKEGVARHVGRGENIWSNVHIDDLVDLYRLAIKQAPAGSFYFAENGENSMREACLAISRRLGLGERTEPLSLEEATAEWGEHAANYTMGANSRVRALRSRKELGWSPYRPSLLESIATEPL